MKAVLKCSLVRVAVLAVLSVSPLVTGHSPLLLAQTTSASVTGLVVDSAGALIQNASVKAVNDATGVVTSTKTNNEGVYYLMSLEPGTYRIQVEKNGFKTLIKPDITLNVQDARALNFTLPVGATSETVTVEGGGMTINTTDGTVSTVVDRQFAENLPMNGRSFQTLIELTPGTVVTPSTQNDSGQFSINGQRASSNYWMVDGVSANFGIGTGIPGNGAAGALPSFSVLGGTNSLVSVDALQEFRIQTSTYAPEFGRTPGGQISILTRSGTNQFHGTLFDYFRNDVLDANDWFADQQGLPKPKERQNDFGGTLGGPVFKDKTFFFFSYEGARLRLPQVALTDVPSLSARQNASPALQPFLNAYPLPNSKIPDTGSNPSPLAGSFSNSATLDAVSIRIDHHLLNGKLALFGRYDYSPSDLIQRAAFGSAALNSLLHSSINTQTATAGATWTISPAMTNDLRVNYSRTYSTGVTTLDNFGGAVPPASFPLPSPFTIQNSSFVFDIFSLQNGLLQEGGPAPIIQRQVNVVDNVYLQKGSHSLKFGIDWRRLSPVSKPLAYSQQAFFSDVPSAASGNLLFSETLASNRSTLLLQNVGAFAQDTWRLRPRLTLTYGIRWDVDFAPSAIDGPSFPAVVGFDLRNPANLALAPAGTPPFNTTYGNFAPRIGIAHQLSQSQNWGTVVRSGFGVFYDLATSELGNNVTVFNYPFGALGFGLGGTFPLSQAAAAPPAVTPASLSSGTLYAFDPHLELPYTLQWSLAVQQSLGTQQTITASYIGSAGRRLLQTAYISAPNANFGSANLVTNSATSDYHALQLQFQRRLSHGLQALASYTWSHSIDTASAGSFGTTSNGLVPTDPNANRGPSDFDIRNTFSAGVTYDIPAPHINASTQAILHGWSLENIVQARSAPPVNVVEAIFFAPQIQSYGIAIRPDVVSGEALYLFGPQFPGGKALNPAAFTPPPVDPVTGLPLRQGDLGRNALRGFGAAQWDFAVHRDFPIHESIKLQFRAEMFNVLNHPNFGPPVASHDTPQFGQSVQMLGPSLSSGNLGSGSFSPLYQIGGPRSIQLALKLIF